ncbi:MAG: hypothetical protein ACRDVP_07560 [Acidimicrobiales bacterium]
MTTDTSKYGHLFLTEPSDGSLDMVYEGQAVGALPPNLGIPWALMRAADIPEASAYVTTSWVREADDRVLWVHEHEHDYDEILLFLGNDPNKEEDLGGEVFMTIEGEEHTLTTTSAVFIPAHTKHCPLGFNSVERPWRFIAIAMSGHGNYLAPKS